MTYQRLFEQLRQKHAKDLDDIQPHYFLQDAAVALGEVSEADILEFIDRNFDGNMFSAGVFSGALATKYAKPLTYEGNGKRKQCLFARADNPRITLIKVQGDGLLAEANVDDIRLFGCSGDNALYKSTSQRIIMVDHKGNSPACLASTQTAIMSRCSGKSLGQSQHARNVFLVDCSGDRALYTAGIEKYAIVVGHKGDRVMCGYGIVGWPLIVRCDAEKVFDEKGDQTFFRDEAAEGLHIRNIGIRLDEVVEQISSIHPVNAQKIARQLEKIYMKAKY